MNQVGDITLFSSSDNDKMLEIVGKVFKKEELFTTIAS